jgi:hypothetical protein
MSFEGDYRALDHVGQGTEGMIRTEYNARRWWRSPFSKASATQRHFASA